MEYLSDQTVERIREHFTASCISSKSVGFILLLETVVCRIKHPCLPLLDVYTKLADKHECSVNSVRTYIKAAVQEANKARKEQGMSSLIVKDFVTECVNLFSEVGL